MRRIVVRLIGMPFDPTYEIDDDTIAVGDQVRVPGSGSSFIQEGEVGTVVALESSYAGPCKRAVRAQSTACLKTAGRGCAVRFALVPLPTQQ